MDASILMVGGSDFLAILLEPIRNLAGFAVQVAIDPHEAVPLIQAQQPDVLVIQVNQANSLNLCRQIKSQSHLAWIYCILLEDQLHGISLGMLPEQGDEVAAKALDAGADAYLRVTVKRGAESPDNSPMIVQSRLLQSQIRAGLRRVQNQRELMRTNDLLSAIALSDPLTELNNRRAFEWELPRQIYNARSRNMPISLLMLDIDYFKAINDRYGHLVGDRVLQLFAARLRHNLRFCDTPFRYGGEEFVIILSDTSCQDAFFIATRLCCLIADQPFAVDHTLDLTVTVSTGATSLLLEDDTKGISLLRRADQNLLKAKSQGRNRVVGCKDFSNALDG